MNSHAIDNENKISSFLIDNKIEIHYREFDLKTNLKYTF